MCFFMGALVIQGVPRDLEDVREFDSVQGRVQSLNFKLEHPADPEPKYRELFEAQGPENIAAVQKAAKDGALSLLKCIPRTVPGKGVRVDGTPKGAWTKYMVLRVVG